MKKTIITLITFYVFLIINAQTDSSISFVAYWNKGDTKNYNVTKKQIQITNGIETIDNTTKYEIRCSVIKSTRKSYTIEWVGENTSLNDIEIPSEFDDVFEKYKIIKIIYKTDELGSFQKIINWKRIRSLMFELFDKLPLFIPNDSINFSEVIKSIKNLYGSQEAIANLIFKEIAYFHYPLGLMIGVFDTIQYERQLPNMLGGDPIKGNGKLYFQSIDNENNICEFVDKVELDSADSKRIVNDFLLDILAKMDYKNQKFNEEFSQMSFKIEENNIFKYDYYLGWPIKININRTSKVTNKGSTTIRIDELIIEEIK